MTAVAGQLPRSRRGEQVQLREGIEVALKYFNTTDRDEVESLTLKAKTWAKRYYRSYDYLSKSPSALLGLFPQIFDLNTEGLARLQPKMAVKTTMPEPESGHLREFRRWERRAVPTEAFPKFCEPSLVPEEVVNGVVETPRRRSPRTQARQATQIGASDLREAGLIDFLPEFLGQLAQGNLDAKISPASTPEPEATEQPEEDMESLAEFRETQQRRHRCRVNVPGGRPFKLPGDETEGSVSNAGSSIVVGQYQESYDSGDETDASTSTTASLRAGRKRKLSASASESFRSNKIRIQYTQPTVNLGRQYLRMLAEYAKEHPDSSAGDALADLQHKIPIPDRLSSSELALPSERTPSPELEDQEEPVPIRVIKISIPGGWLTPEGSLPGSPDIPSPPKVITLVDPRSRSPSPTAPAAAASRSASPESRIKLKDPRSRTTSPVDFLRRSLTPSGVIKSRAIHPRQKSPVRLPRSSAAAKRATRIKVVNKTSPAPETRAASPISPGTASPSGSTSSSNLEITRPGSSCSNTSLDSTWSSTSKKITRIKWINKRALPTPNQSAPALLTERAASPCPEEPATPRTFKIPKRPRVKSVGEANMRSSKVRLVGA
ncbi:hypothetical protein QBC40DRAFT_27314 [Triangularia verruculosa]|uniref:Uncharacterized protein n=1 Tax=Triangularia verruculosa TaxID=2587418 RepID=A0AAN6XQ46_9PEZI|nr:hypothetical protein QBC40DRAFT_27314 [Triangularia verruculosa]